MKYAIGIDIGGTGTKLGVVDEKGNVLKHHEFKTTDYKDFPSYTDGLEKAVKHLVSTTDGECMGVGVGAPNGNAYTGMIEYAPNLPFERNAPIVDTLKKKLGYDTVCLSNDANAAAIGEKIYGGGRELDHFILITLGTGLGSGIISDGKIMLGADGSAGELGHVCAVPNGRLCGCTKRGCLETYASATGIKRTFLEMVAKYNGDSSIANTPWDKLDARVIEDAAKAGDRASIETYKITGSILGRCLADFVLFSRPSAIFLFGGPVKSGDLILEPTRASMEKNLMPVFRGKVKVLPSELPLGDAAILGASAMVWSAK
ncbi:MAG: ROK family protein [Opitutales bacterium]|nr:ROK family protein [Opitutales bacterium]